MPSLYSQRAAFEKALHTELRPLLKKSAWRKSQYALFLQSGEYYQEVYFSVHRNAEMTSASLRFKPMGIDPILWDILSIPENRNEPLSFRSRGAFTCSALPILEAQLEQPGSTPAEVAAALIALANRNTELFRESPRASRFSTLVANHPNQVARGAYAITLVTSLIHEGDLAAAKEVASSYASGERISVASFSSGDKSFHELAAEWIDASPQLSSAV